MPQSDECETRRILDQAAPVARIATYTYSRQLQFSTGFAYIMPGEFLKHATSGHAYSYPFVMVTYVFLGEHAAPVRKPVS